MFASLITVIFIYIQYKESNDSGTIEEAMVKSNINYDEIYHITEKRGYTIVFYGKDDGLSVGLITKTRSGYRWIFGAGSKQFNEGERILTRAFSNLPTKNYGNDNEIISLTFGVINDEEIKNLKIQYKDQDLMDATIIPTSKGRIWFCFSDTPVNYDPDVIRVNKNGETVSGWN